MYFKKSINYIGYGVIAFALLFNFAQAHNVDNHKKSKPWKYSSTKYDNFHRQHWGISKREIHDAWGDVLTLWPEKSETVIGQYFDSEGYDEISDYQVDLPHTSYPKISMYERNLLRIYLDHPDNVEIAKILALFNLKRSLLVGHKNSGLALKRTVIAQYFLHRVQAVENENRWVDHTIGRVERILKRYIHPRHEVDLDGDLSAHEYFINAFNYNEQNRYRAGNYLLKDYLENSDNAFTSFYLMASHSWISGEERYNDPVILNNMITASYFSLRAMDLARRAEEAWFEDSQNNMRFRLSTIVGGLSMISRQWLAALHGDPVVIEALNNEHREWRLVQKPFHSFTAGYAFFEDWATFGESMAAWEDAFNECTANPTQRTCMDRPRFSFNPIPMVTGYTDFLLKVGVTDVAEMLLYQVTTQDGFDQWDIGQDPWSHRLNNMEAIVEKYQNADPTDDPVPLMMANIKWGRNLPTCQICHQAQSRVWTPEEQDEILLPLEQYATVGNWPLVSATWYGKLIVD